jgi:hypothetical protein
MPADRFDCRVGKRQNGQTGLQLAGGRTIMVAWASLIARIDSGGSNASATAWANVACSTCIGHSRPSGAGKMTG